MPTDSVTLTAHNVFEGGTLVFDWLIYDACGNIITDPDQVVSITVYSNTLAVDATTSISSTLRGDELIDDNGNLKNETTITGYTTSVRYTTRVEAWILDPSVNGRYEYATAHKVTSDFLNKKIRGDISTINPIIIVIPGDGKFDVYFDSSSADLFTNRIADASSGIILDYAKMYANVYYNDGTGMQIATFFWVDFLTNGFVEVTDLSNVAYEVFASYSNADQYIAGDSLSSAGVTTTPTDKPNPPSEIYTMSRYEYNRYNAASALNVTDSSFITILWNAGPQDVGTNEIAFKIYKSTIASNGVTVTSTTLIATIPVAQTLPSSYGGVDFSYNYTDTSVTRGSFFGYQIVGVNANGDGVSSSPIKCALDGSKATAPTIVSVSASNSLVTLDMSASSVNANGFTFNPNNALYTVQYYGPNASDASGTVTNQTSPITITGLTNSIQYTFNVYAQITNSYYSGYNGISYTGDYDISTNLIGSPLTYLSTAVSTQAIPYVSPNAPSGVIVQPSFLRDTPLGTATVRWISDTSFAGQWLRYRIQSYDASSNQLVDTYYVDDFSGNPPNGTPSRRVYVDTDFELTKGTQFYYKVSSYYVVSGQDVYSLPTTSSNNTYQQYYDPSINAGNVIAFTNPSSPSIQNVSVAPDVSGNAQVVFTVVSPVGNLNAIGGLPIYQYFARVDGSGVGVPYFNGLVTANVPTTVDVSANNTYTISAYDTTRGPDASGNATTTYSSLTVSTTAGIAYTQPVLTNYSIDASGVLNITSLNNGSSLNFIEGLVIDSSDILQVSYATNVVGTTSNNKYLNGGPTTGFVILQNDTTTARVTVNFNDPNLANSNQKLIIVTNAAGADVYNSFN
jgi:hypothetical protein